MTQKQLDEIKDRANDWIKNPNYGFYYDNPGAAGEDITSLYETILYLINTLENKKLLK